MPHLDAMLEPGEEVRARSGTVTSWVVAGLVGAGYGFVIVATRSLASWLQVHTALPEFPAWAVALTAVVLAFLLILHFSRLLSMIPNDARVLVTDRRVLFRDTPLDLVRRSLDLSLVTGATAYTADRLLILHLADGKDIRLQLIEEIESVARALDVPARVWRPGIAHKISTELDRFSNLAFLAVVAVMLATYFLVDGAAGLWDLSEITRLLCWVVAIPAAGWVASFLLYGVARHFLAARRLDHRAMRYFACSRLDRRYQGHEPWPETGGSPWIWRRRAIRRWILRHAYKGKLDCACEPREIGPQDGGGGAA